MEFKGWVTTKDGTTAFNFDGEITTDTNLYAKFETATVPEVKNTVTYYDGDTVLLEQSVEENGKAYNWTPVKAGMEFKGWVTTKDGTTAFDFDGEITTDTNLYATFEEATVPEIKNIVTYYDGDTVLLKQSVDKNGKAYNWTPVKADMEFKGWVTTKDGTTAFDFDGEITTDTNLYATFEEAPVPEVNYVVTFVDQDGTTIYLEQKVAENGTIYNWTPEKFGFNFVGWQLNGAVFNAATPVTGDITLTAKWNEIVKEKPFAYDIAHLNEDGTSFTYKYGTNKEQVIQINESTIYLDGRLSDYEIAGYKNVYNDFNKALDACKSGTEDNPMKLYIAPYVYWIHNPDSDYTEHSVTITKNCANLHMIGLSEDPRDIVIAANYGHDEGFNGGNHTGFSMSGDGLTLKNITFGNYCNVDLVYPLNPSLNRAKRTNNVTQGQIASYSGDKLYAENCQFISRLNMMPFISSKRALYVNCHMESTDDSLNGSAQAVYLNCDLEHYASKPWGGTSGVTLLNCDMKICPINADETLTQYISKGAGRATLVDCRYRTEHNVSNVNIGFSDILSSTFRSYYSNVTVKIGDGTPQQVRMDDGGKNADKAVDITDTEMLKAYKLDDNGTVVYNVYNLLRGADDWDPLGQKEIITRLNATNVATGMSARATGSTTIENQKEGGDRVTLSYSISGPQAGAYTDTVEWKLLNPTDSAYVTLTTQADGTCVVQSVNDQDVIPKVIVVAKAASGLEAAVEVTAKPNMIAAPAFTDEPTIAQGTDGTASVSYTLDLGERADMSEIIWYICDDASGTNAREIAVGRADEPLKSINLVKGYVGKYLKVGIKPKHLRCEYGALKEVVASVAITDTGITESNTVKADISTISTKSGGTIAGAFTVDSHKPLDTVSGGNNHTPFDGAAEGDITTTPGQFENSNAEGKGDVWQWAVGNKNGVLDYEGIYQTQARSSRINYKTTKTSTGDMAVTVKVAPGKTASQGFGSANQFMDVMIKYDIETETGYGLRIYRISGNSCGFMLLEYKEGKTKALTKTVESTVYLTECTIKLWTETVGNETKLKCTVETSNPDKAEQTLQTLNKPDATASVSLEATIENNAYGDFSLQHYGTVGDNVTYIGDIELEYKD